MLTRADVCSLQNKCQLAVKALTQDEARYIELNPVIAKVCKGAIKQNCMVSGTFPGWIQRPRSGGGMSGVPVGGRCRWCNQISVALCVLLG